jgi:hypothetical protein
VPFDNRCDRNLGHVTPFPNRLICFC